MFKPTEHLLGRSRRKAVRRAPHCSLVGGMKLAVCLLGISMLAGCGFEPLMARGNAAELSRVHVLPIPDRSGQILRNHLFDDLATPRGSGAPLYFLEVLLTEPRQEIAVRRDESASRVSYTANATFILRDTTGRVAFAGRSVSSSTYEAATSEFASIAGQRSARDRAMQDLSADIRQQLAAYFSRVQSSGQAQPTGQLR